jgi:hypothetical protein
MRLSQSTPSKLPAHSPSRGAGGGLLCPGCNGDSFTEKTSFTTTSEPLLGAVSANVVIDLMSCQRCGIDLPAVRGKRRYALLSEKKLSSIVADLEEAQRINLQNQGLVEMMDRRFQHINVEIERRRAEEEISILEAKIAGLEAETDGMESSRARLAAMLDTIATTIPAV